MCICPARKGKSTCALPLRLVTNTRLSSGPPLKQWGATVNQTTNNERKVEHYPDAQRLDDSVGFLNRVFGIKTVAGEVGCLAAIVAVAAIPFLGMASCSNQMAESNRAAAEHAKIQQAADEAAYQQSVRTGAVCEDGPNGLNTAFQLNVMRRLKDPDSFQHIRSVIVPSGKSGQYDAFMQFRSKNSFGGYTVGSAVGTLYVAERGVCEVRSFNVEG